jgi:uncharacterized protein (TIGR00369 family)
MAYSVSRQEGNATGAALRTHAHCVVCGQENPRGFHMRFIRGRDGSVESRFDCARALEGYPRQLHGGVIASLLDGAMTNCLFMHGRTAVTAEMNVRYHHPVQTDRTAFIRGWIEQTSPRLHLLKAEVVQDGVVRATASGKFMNRPGNPQGEQRYP